MIYSMLFAAIIVFAGALVYGIQRSGALRLARMNTYVRSLEYENKEMRRVLSGIAELEYGRPELEAELILERLDSERNRKGLVR